MSRPGSSREKTGGRRRCPGCRRFSLAQVVVLGDGRVEICHHCGYYKILEPDAATPPRQQQSSSSPEDIPDNGS